jgi:hypothetical protein
MIQKTFMGRLTPAARLIGQLARGWDLQRWKVEDPTAAIALGIHTLRSQLFLAESLPLLWLQRPTIGTKSEAPPPEALEATLDRLRELLERDARRIGQGLAPLSVLAPRDPIGHGARLLRILADATRVSTRKRARRNREFGRQARRWLDDLPSYYRRNFHHQTDG